MPRDNVITAAISRTLLQSDLAGGDKYIRRGSLRRLNTG
jgi:hypothetical protein